MPNEIHPIVRNNTYIGHGYWVDANEYLTIGNKIGFLNSPYTMEINKDEYNRNPNPNYFFGIKIVSVVTGQGFILPSTWNLDEEEVEAMKTAFKSFVTNRTDYGCHDYVIADREVTIH